MDEDVSLEASPLALNIMNTAQDVMRALAISSSAEKRILHIKWVSPDDGVVKLNTDGAAKGNPGVAGAGDSLTIFE
ncbi:hypothetical protein COLO4_37729 [Corchorus olitorius]|uniref:Uncharacterized protein n=1 Tax=Corchorus olitorius TaxID=93759 RepID=A0A1R3FZQ8_9ROSI|nr:hypothetical protein COLO4_37729 [Corchorus olitorius]